MRTDWLVFTPHGAFSSEGDTAKIALNRFMRLHPAWEIAGIIRSNLVIKPPEGPGAPPFLCSFIKGRLTPMPQVNEGIGLPPKGEAR